MHKIIKLPMGSSVSKRKVSYSRRGNDGEEIEKHAIVSFHVSKGFERIIDNQILKNIHKLYLLCILEKQPKILNKRYIYICNALC